MKRALFLGVVTLLALNVGCGKVFDKNKNKNNPPPGPILDPVTVPTEEVRMKVDGGYATISKDEIVRTEVVLITREDGWLGKETKSTRKFSGTRAYAPLVGLRLDEPAELEQRTLGRETGQLKIVFRDRETNELVERSFAIVNETVLEDRDFPEVKYQSETKLDAAWLKSL